MTGSRLLALDLGTTGVRALLVDGEGKALARAYRPLATRFPEPGRVEQDPEEMCEFDFKPEARDLWLFASPLRLQVLLMEEAATRYAQASGPQ